MREAKSDPFLCWRPVGKPVFSLVQSGLLVGTKPEGSSGVNPPHIGRFVSEKGLACAVSRLQLARATPVCVTSTDTQGAPAALAPRTSAAGLSPTALEGHARGCHLCRKPGQYPTATRHRTWQRIAATAAQAANCRQDAHRPGPHLRRCR